MQKYFNSVQNRDGDAINSATVTVTTLAGGAATLYTDNGVTPLVGPLLTDINGYFQFYAADGRYTLAITRAGITPITITDILLEDPADGSAALAASSGSSLVGFLQAGTGAVARTVQDKERDIVSVFDFMTTAQKADVSAGTLTLDVTVAIQAAHDYAASLGVGGPKEVVFPAGKYAYSSLNWSPLVAIRTLGNVILRSSITSGKGLYISTRFGNWAAVGDQTAYNANMLIHGKLVIENATGSGGNTATGVFFGDDGVAAFSAESLSIKGLQIRGWSNSHRFGSHAYLITFEDCNFRFNGNVIYNDAPATYIDRLERIGYVNCTIANNTNVIDGAVNYEGDFGFHNCSIDYNTRFNTNVANIAIVVIDGGSHLEWDSDQTFASVAGGALTIADSYYVKVTGANATPLIASISGGGHFRQFGNSYNTPNGVELYRIADAISTISGEKTVKQFGGAPAAFAFGVDTVPVNNVGAGHLRLYPELAEFTQSIGATGSIRLPGGLTLKWGTIPTTAIGSNASVTVTATFSTAFTTAVVFAGAFVQPDGSADFYGVTQKIITGTPLATTQFAIRNGAAAQNFINGTWFAVGY